MGFFGFGKKKEKEQQSAQTAETRLEAQADETSGAENAQTPADDAEQAAQGPDRTRHEHGLYPSRVSLRRAETWPAAWMS